MAEHVPTRHAHSLRGIITVEITLNGHPQRAEADASVADLVRQLGLRPEQVAVEVNRELVPRGEHARRQLQPGDELEIVTLVGGG